MSTTYGYTKQVESNQQGSKHTRAISPKKGTYVRRLTKPASLVHEHMFIDHRTYVHRPSNICSPKSPLFDCVDVGRNHVIVELNDRSEMNTEHGYRKQVESHHQGSKHTLAILMSKLRSSLGAAWEQARSSLGAAWSEARVWLEYAYTHLTGGQTPCAEVFRLLVSLLLMLVLGSTSVWGQKVADGVYYIKHDAGTSGIWYLWPSVTTNPSTGNAYLTTSNVTSLDEAVVQGVNNNQVGYGPFNKTYSHWIVKNVDGEESTIQLINPKLNKYVVIREKTYGDRDVWLADKPDDATISYSYFVINLNIPPYRISPFPGLNDVQTTDAYTFNSASGTDRAWLTWSEGGKDYSRSGEGRAGLIQFYNKDAQDKKGKPLWFFEPNLLDAPTISDVGANDVVTVTDANDLPDGYKIRYTTDSSIPTASSPVMEGNSFTVTSTFTLKAVVERYGVVLTKVAEKDVAPAPCATPVIAFDNTTSKVSIASTTPECTFYYTTDGTEPTTSNTEYSSPFSINSSTTVMAIATKSGYPNSEIASVKVVFNPTISLATNEYTYDGSAKEPTVSSVMDGETPIATSKYTVTYSGDNINAGTATVNIKDIAGDDLIVSGSANFTINPKAVTITANDASKAYNGIALTESGFTTTALETGDTHTFTVVMTEGSTITNIGTEPNVIATVDGTAVTTGTETAIGNYLVTTANGTLTINPKAVTITAKDASKAYDGTALTESGFTTTALETGDTHTFTVVMTEGSTITNIGTEPNVIATVDGTAVTTGTGTAIGNYLVTTANGTLTITPKPLTITAGSDTKVYDSTPLTKNSYTHTELLTGDKIEGVTVTGSQTNAGTSDNVLSAAVIKNSNDDDVTANYHITYTNGTLTVTPKPITVKADNKWKAYGEADPRLTYTSGGLLNNDAITGTLSRVAGENVGTYAITVGGLTAGDNYEISFTGANLTIVKAELTVTANNHSITYGDEPAGNGVTCEGFVGEESSAVLGGTLAYDFSYTRYGDVGNTYTIKPKGLTSSNYEITFSTGKLTVSPKEVGLTWSETTFPYDGSPHAPTATATGLVNGDKIGVTVSGAETNAGDHTATASALTGTKKHNYKLPEDNTHTFTISPKRIGNGTTLADGYTLNFGENNTILLTDDVIGSALVLSTDYSVGEDTDTSEGYYTRTVTGIGNYTGSFTVRNASVAFSTDTEQDRWSGTFVAEKKNEGDIGFALPEGFSAFIISGIRGEWAIPEPLNYIPADVPVLLVANHQTQGFVVTEASSSEVTAITPDQKGKNMLEKVTEATSGYDPDTQSAPFGTKQIYLLYKNEFVFNKAGNLKKGKVYLNPNHSASSPEPAPARLMIAWNHTTGIEDGRGKIEDGSSERWYTLDGRCLSGKPTTKGLYIVNGKKTVIK